jgi:hypothetical protein
MAAQAAHLVDCVLPAVPIRQFVLSLPFELSRLAAIKPDVLRALARIHAEELARHYKRTAKPCAETSLIATTGAKLHTGAVTFVQRFGSSLNLHVHMHTCALDGIYIEPLTDKTTESDAALRFLPATPPTRAELHLLLERIARRVMSWLRKRGYLCPDDTDASNDSPNLSFAELLANIGTQRGTVENLKDATGERDSPNEPAATFTNETVTHLGFNLHASLTLRADDDRGRERLCRYGLRPPFALSRFRVLPDGRISYRVKKSTRRVSRCRVMTPVECIARLCALIPPPRYPLTRFHGVLAPRAKLRPRVVPKLPDSVRALRACNAANTSQDATEKRDKKKRPREERPPPRDRSGSVIPNALPISATLLARQIDGAEVLAPNVLSAKHLDRIHGGLLFAATSSVPWAVLLARTFDVDSKACPRCEGRLVVRAVVSDLSVARQILDSLAKQARAPPRHEEDAHDAVLVLDQDYA